MLPTAYIDESTYEGNDEIVGAALKYLGFGSTDELKKLGCVPGSDCRFIQV